MLPESGGPLVIGVIEQGGSGAPFGSRCRNAFVDVVIGSGGGISRGDVLRRRQIPGLGITVAFLAGVATMKVRDNGHRTPIRPWISAVHIPAFVASRGIRPMKGLVNRQRMRQIFAGGVHQLVDPLHPHLPVVFRLDAQI